MGDPLERVEEKLQHEKKESTDFINQPSSASGSTNNIKTLLENDQIDISAKLSG